TIFSELPELLDYYLRRWRSLNLLEPAERHWTSAAVHVEEFTRAPEELIARLVEEADETLLPATRSTRKAS
ncbi:MAG: hypothetical protein AAGC67_16620, partial [Myxococcota bacterium]